ncbi:hypothetical protein [Methanopyrus kandleri]|uniref:Uncharacterized protein specific for M.kandleri, MK-22 family n=2 Tax=Methanopyrus kandleri TaxID=2320 RepID=Q8TYI4_METKA|nr:hypothetical protein [Methanopyrus kandleri]AAM01530.1 Uncharacterized protein specific for M.kandleri, MK-22 family [Methanopyrus kandleri AV19]HII70538.1 hypothetical protein [Methanopyrus kandleri]
MLLPALLTLLLLPGPVAGAPVDHAVDLPSEGSVSGGDLDRECVEAVLDSCSSVRWCVVRAPGVEEGAVFERCGERWVEVGSGDCPGRCGVLLRGLDAARVSWASGTLRVSGPVGASAWLLVPDPRGLRVGGTFLQGGAYPEGAGVFRDRRVSVRRGRSRCPGRCRLGWLASRW